MFRRYVHLDRIAISDGDRPARLHAGDLRRDARTCWGVRCPCPACPGGVRTVGDYRAPHVALITGTPLALAPYVSTPLRALASPDSEDDRATRSGSGPVPLVGARLLRMDDCAGDDRGSRGRSRGGIGQREIPRAPEILPGATTDAGRRRAGHVHEGRRKDLPRVSHEGPRDKHPADAARREGRRPHAVRPAPVRDVPRREPGARRHVGQPRHGVVQGAATRRRSPSATRCV